MMKIFSKTLWKPQRITAVFSALALSFCAALPALPASAANSVYTYSFDQYDLQPPVPEDIVHGTDFSDADSLGVNWQWYNNSGSGQFYSISYQGGLGGRAKDDQAMAVNVASHVCMDKRALTLRNRTPGQDSAMNLDISAPGAAAVVELDFYRGPDTTDDFNLSDNTVARLGGVNLVHRAGETGPLALSIIEGGGYTYRNRLMTEGWHKLQTVVTNQTPDSQAFSKTIKIEIYFDGVKGDTKTTQVNDGKVYLAGPYINLGSKDESSQVQSTTMAIDNVRWYMADSPLTEPFISAGGSLSVNNAARTISSLGGETVDDLTAALSGASLKAVIGGDGTEKQGGSPLQTGDRILVTDGTLTQAYYLQQLRAYPYFYYDFDRAGADTVTDPNTLGNGWSLDGGGSVSLSGGVAGKTETDRALTLASQGLVYTGDGSNTPAVICGAMTSAPLYKNNTLSLDFCFTDDAVGFAFDVVYLLQDAASSGGQTMSTQTIAAENGQLCFFGQPVSVRAEPDIWHTLTLINRFADNTGELYLDGVSCGQAALYQGLASGQMLSGIDRLRLAVCYPADSGIYDGSLGIDNLWLTPGCRDEVLTLNADTEELAIDNAARTILIPEARTAAQANALINAQGNSLRFFQSDGTPLDPNTTLLQDDYALVSNDLTTLRYYITRTAYTPPGNRPVIACWGDSLTYGDKATPGNSYPDVLSRLTGLRVYNLGVNGETATTIMARQGALEIRLPESFTIPASGSVALPLASAMASGQTCYYFPTEDDGKVVPRDVNAGMWSPVTICGVPGVLTASVNSTAVPKLLDSAAFTRLTPGEPVEVPANTLLQPAAQSIQADINIFFVGTNGGWTPENGSASDNAGQEDQLAALIQKGIDRTPDPSSYIVIGLTTGSANAWVNTNGALAEAFGENFLDLKAALATEQALTDAGLIATQQDLADIANGAIPSSLLDQDRTHFNDNGYRMVAQTVYAKLQQLGYLD